MEFVLPNFHPPYGVFFSLLKQIYIPIPVKNVIELKLITDRATNVGIQDMIHLSFELVLLKSVVLSLLFFNFWFLS